jgi:hypothetical protein
MRNFQKTKEVREYLVRSLAHKPGRRFIQTKALSSKSENTSEVENSTIMTLRSWLTYLKLKGNSS